MMMTAIRITDMVNTVLHFGTCVFTRLSSSSPLKKKKKLVSQFKQVLFFLVSPSFLDICNTFWFYGHYV